MENGTRLNLGTEWEIGERLGGGGFGVVYAAKSANQDSAVVKLVPKAPGAEREMLFVDLRDVRNVVPIIDSGETEDRWALVMPRADKSLRQYLEDTADPLNASETITVLSDILAALSDLDGSVVHRDLKPENILLLDGHWCLADFGISRYAEATTAPDTHKYSMSPPYAAPERWRSERATIAADVYAVGVMAHEMLTGARPFAGPSIEVYRDQHLHHEPPSLSGVSAALAALVEECLYKAPEARPAPSNLLARLSRLAQAATPSGGLAALQDANRVEVGRRGAQVRAESESRSESERRAALVQAARGGLTRITDQLKDAVLGAAPATTQQARTNGGWSLTLGAAELRFAPPSVTSSSSWGQSERPIFDVVAYAELSITIPQDRFGYQGRSHSLWYCDAQESGRYQWFETAFMVSPMLREPIAPRNPFALEPDAKAGGAVGPGMASYQVAWPFTALTPDDLDEFIGRWAGWFAAAMQGQLHLPSSMPERPVHESWRRS